MRTLNPACLALLLALPSAQPSLAIAQALRDLVPAKAPNCAVTAPPPDAGIAATPGGFAVVFPRNAALPRDYTGCKVLWVLDGDRPRRLATLYFDGGVLRTAVAHDARSDGGKVDAACAFPAGKSLLPKAGRRLPDSGCAGFGGEAFYGLHLPTWPQSCLSAPESDVCKKDPD